MGLEGWSSIKMQPDIDQDVAGIVWVESSAASGGVDHNVGHGHGSQRLEE